MASTGLKGYVLGSVFDLGSKVSCSGRTGRKNRWVFVVHQTEGFRRKGHWPFPVTPEGKATWVRVTHTCCPALAEPCLPIPLPELPLAKDLTPPTVISAVTPNCQHPVGEQADL